MKYSTEPRNRIYVKGYGFLSFAKYMGKNLSSKYGQKLLDTTKKPGTDALKTASKRVLRKTTETTGDLVGNKTADKITSATSQNNKCKSKASATTAQRDKVPMKITGEKHIPLEK